MDKRPHIGYDPPKPASRSPVLWQLKSIHADGSFQAAPDRTAPLVKPCQTLHLLRKTLGGSFAQCAVPDENPKNASGVSGGGNAAAETNLLDRCENT
jgi:hypothetical protein